MSVNIIETIFIEEMMSGDPKVSDKSMVVKDKQ